jgi:knotted carbamoyltransferase YgeW
MAHIDRTFPSLDHDAIQALRGRSMVSTNDYSRADLDALSAVANAFCALDGAGIKTPLFPHELAWALFFDKSTRTKSAWAGSASRLGMQPVIVDGGTTQVSHGETAEETGAMIGMNSHAMGIRHCKILGQGRPFIADNLKGITDYLAAMGDPRTVPMVNLQCDWDHPTQSMADLLWLEEYCGGSIRGKKIAVSWAYSPSYAKPLSVPQGLITLLTRYGAHVTLAHPLGYPLYEEAMDQAVKHSLESGGSFRYVDDMDAAFQGADVVYPKSWGPVDLMVGRQDAKSEAEMNDIERRAVERNAQFRDWICDERRMGLTDDALYMHCLPADIGDEVTHGIMDKFRVECAREANYKMYVMMALIASAKQDGLGEILEKFWNDR